LPKFDPEKVRGRKCTGNSMAVQAVVGEREIVGRRNGMMSEEEKKIEAEEKGVVAVAAARNQKP